MNKQFGLTLALAFVLIPTTSASAAGYSEWSAYADSYLSQGQMNHGSAAQKPGAINKTLKLKRLRKKPTVSKVRNRRLKKTRLRSP